jgi:hypothetical protein
MQLVLGAILLAFSVSYAVSQILDLYRVLRTSPVTPSRHSKCSKAIVIDGEYEVLN